MDALLEIAVLDLPGQPVEVDARVLHLLSVPVAVAIVPPYLMKTKNSD